MIETSDELMEKHIQANKIKEKKNLKRLSSLCKNEMDRKYEK